MSKLRNGKRESARIQTKLQYFKMLDSSILPKIMSSASRYNNERTPEKVAQKIVKSQHFIYIDLDEQSGCKIMEKGTPKDNQEQLQKLGNSYIFNLKNLSQRNQQTLDFLYKQKQSQQQKDTLRKLVKSQLDRSISKLNTKKKFKGNYDQIKQRRKLDFDSSKLKELVQNTQFETLNDSIWLKQKKLIQKLGIINNYSSISPQKKDSENHSTLEKTKVIKTSILPSLNFKTIEH